MTILSPVLHQTLWRSVAVLLLFAVFGLGPAEAQPAPGYYDGADASSPGALRASLHEIIDDHTRYPYTSSAVDTWDILEIADENQDDPGSVIAVYRNASYPKQGGGNTMYNREHSWPKSYGFPNDGTTNYPFTDVHHLFLADSGYNSSRSNKPFDLCSSACAEKTTDPNNGRGGQGGGYPGDSNWTTGSFTEGTWEVWTGRRGDVARALMYMDVRYEGGVHGVTGVVEPDLVLTDDRALIAASNTGSNEPVAYMGLLTVLLEWHDADPVDVIEMQRNEAAASFQGNRNPFIDRPEWVDCVFRAICGGGTPDTTPPAAPTGLVATGGAGFIELDWADNAETDLAGYNVYRAEVSGGPYTRINSGLVGSSGFQDGGVSTGVTYFYVVTADDFSGNESAISAEASAGATEGGTSGSAWINEFHYDNDGTDTGEFVEVAGPAGLDLTGWSLVGYNGNGGGAYATVSLSGGVPDQQGCTGAVQAAFGGLQNGSPDGIALVDAGGRVVEFLSYEGTLTAVDGPAAGLTSTDTGVSESGTTPVGHSLQLGGTGASASDFLWQDAQSATPGQVNAGQTFDGCAADTVPPPAPSGLTAAGLDAQVSLDWADNAEADLAGYNVYRATAAGGPYAQVHGSPVAFSDYIDTGVTNGERYYYVVTALDTAGNESGNSEEASAQPAPAGATAWINEFHYDNDGADSGEFVEVAGPAGLDLAGWRLVAYNGNGGAAYAAVDLSGTVPDLEAGFGVLAFDLPGLQNGSPDGIALVDGAGAVLEFLSYEGVLTAADGPAAGMTSVDVGVSEASTTPLGWSLQRTGTGQGGDSFTWAEPQPDTYGAANAGQGFGATSDPDTTPPAAPTGLSAAAGNRKVDLAWAANGEGDLAGYRVFRSEQAGGPYAPVAEVGAPDTAYTDSGLDNGTTYYYVLTATDAAGNESPPSGEVGATPQKGGGRGANK